jgi:uncharacterized Zn-binding protein involved in type VI secretion
MGKAAAKSGDKIKGNDTHTVVLSSNGVSEPRSFSFSGSIASGLSGNVRINSQFAAVVGSGADNVPAHNAGSDSFAVPPSNKGSVFSGSATVKINSKAAARHGDKATTCNEPPTRGNGQVDVANATTATVRFGD